MANSADDNAGERLAALTVLHDLLLEERAALAARDQAAIHDCAERKAVQAARVDAMLATPACMDAASASERAQLERIARECAELNRANGVTVAALRAVVDRALGILRGEDPAESTVYGPGGARRAAVLGRYAGSA